MAEPVTPTNRTENYQPIPGVFDELRDAAGLRPHWQNFIVAFNTLGTEEWSRRWDQARRMIREHGVTYHVQGEPTGLDRPWELDPVPLVLPPFVGAIGLRQIFGQYGALNALLQYGGLLGAGHTIDWLAHGRFWGIALVQALNLYPVIYLNAAAALANVDPAMEEAALDLGATPLQAFWLVIVPCLRPAIVAGALMAFTLSWDELIVTSFTTNAASATLPIRVFGMAKVGLNPMLNALSALFIVATVAFVIFSDYVKKLGR